MVDIQKAGYDIAEQAFEKISKGVPLLQVAAELQKSPEDILEVMREHRKSFTLTGKDADMEMLKQFEYGRLEHAQGMLAGLLGEIGGISSLDYDEKAKILSSAAQVATAFTRISERKSKLAGFDEPVETRHVMASITPESLLRSAEKIRDAELVEH